MLQIPGNNREAMLEGCGTDPDVFDPDRYALGLQHCKQIPGTKRFRLAERKDVDATQNLAGNSFPQVHAVGNPRRSVAKLRNAYH